MASTNPIIRSTPEQRLANFQANATSIYNKFTPFTNNGIGPSQPFVYTKISDSNISRNLTKYDTQAFPVGSTVRDLKRIGQYMITGKGLLYTSKQLLLQNTNAFNETRIYNPLSLLKATAKPGSTGLIDYPQRHLETSGGILNFFKDALLSTIGMQSQNLQQSTIDGTATGPGLKESNSAYSRYANKNGGARAGLVRYNTAIKASTRFDTVWVSNTKNGGSGNGFLSNLGKALINRLISFIPSTNPLGAFGGDVNSWIYRPEYPNAGKGIYFKFLEDSGDLLPTTSRIAPTYYNAPNPAVDIDLKRPPIFFHKYSPLKATTYGSSAPTMEGKLYAGPVEISQEPNDPTDSNRKIGAYGNNILTKLNGIVRESATDTKPQLKRSAEMYTTVKDFKGVSYRVYEDIPSTNPSNGKDNFYVGMGKTNSITLDDRMFAKVSKYKENSIANASDQYNALEVFEGKRDIVPDQLKIGDQSIDLIFFYFFDLINKKYIPFRATISALSDQHSADWEDINYLGRADKLFLYKGFSRDVSFSFTVYANSAIEMLPMWNRINYLVGLTKPSDYTGNPIDEGTSTTGKESRFIYPPMVTLRLGDLFYDQPCVISNVGVNIPDDTNWESLRSDSYYYDSSSTNRIDIEEIKSRQLPMKVDVSVQLKLMEKRRALGSDLHYGNASYNSFGYASERWTK